MYMVVKISGEKKTFFQACLYRVHRAVIFVIAQLSCLDEALIQDRYSSCCFVLLHFCCMGATHFKNPKAPLRRFKSDLDEMWQDCPSSKYTHRLTESNFSYDVTHTYKMAIMTSFHAEKCCHLLSGHPCVSASASCPLTILYIQVQKQCSRIRILRFFIFQKNMTFYVFWK